MRELRVLTLHLDRQTGLFDDRPLRGYLRSVETAFTWHRPAASPPRPKAARDTGADEAVQSLLQEARTSLRLGERDKALAKARAAQRLSGARALTRARLGALLLTLDDKVVGAKLRDQALSELAARARSEPDMRVDHVAALALVQPDEALAVARAAVAKASDESACAWVTLVDTLASGGRRPDARALAEQIVGRAPRCKSAWLSLGGLTPHLGAGAATALAVANRALRELPDDIDLLFMKGSALHGAWRNEEAAVIWELVLARDLHHPGAMGLLATAYTQLDESTDDAFIARFEARLRRDPNDVVAAYAKGTIHYYRGEFAQVLQALEPLQEVVPEEPRVWLYTAMAHFELGRPDKTEALLARVAALTHDDPDYYYCRSILNRERDFDQSLADLERFERLSRGRLITTTKLHRVRRTIEVMRSGRLPTWWDLLPGWLRWGLPIAVVLALLALGMRSIRRRGA